MARFYDKNARFIGELKKLVDVYGVKEIAVEHVLPFMGRMTEGNKLDILASAETKGLIGTVRGPRKQIISVSLG